MSRMLSIVALFCVAISSVGCNQPNQIDIEFDGDEVFLTLRAQKWDWRMQPTMVRGLAIADDDRALWEIKATEPVGVPAANLEIQYGEVPNGFFQVTPGGRRPGRLEPGKTYYVGATGPDDAVWRAVFALPVGRYGDKEQPDFFPEEDPPAADLSDPE